MSAEHSGSERAETDVEKAERIIRVKLKCRNWAEESLRQRPKGAAERRGRSTNGGKCEEQTEECRFHGFELKVWNLNRCGRSWNYATGVVLRFLSP